MVYQGFVSSFLTFKAQKEQPIGGFWRQIFIFS